MSDALGEYAEEAGRQPAADVRRYLEWQLRGNGRDLDGYLRALLRDGKAKGTADKVRREVQAFYRHFGLRAPKVRGWRYDARREGKHEALGPELVAAMVHAARGSLPPHLRAMLCLATVYGLRAGEIAMVGRLDFDGQRVYVPTEKHGRAAWQWLPPEIHPHLEGWRPTDLRRVQAAFGHLWAAVSDQPKPKQLGWHAVRRALVVALRRAGAPDADIARFMRWSGGGGRSGAEAMVDWYGDPSAVVGEEAEAPGEEREGTREEDARVWDAHPFLRLWR